MVFAKCQVKSNDFTLQLMKKAPVQLILGAKSKMKKLPIFQIQ